MSDIEDQKPFPRRPERKNRLYFSARRKGTAANSSIEFRQLSQFFLALFRDFESFGYFSQAFGQDCLDGSCPGNLPGGPALAMEYRLGKQGLWPIPECWEKYSEEDLFDVIEFLYDFISKPTDAYFHTYGGCGWHFTAFDESAGRLEFRRDLNPLLALYRGGFTLCENGEIQHLGDPAIRRLVGRPIPSRDEDNIISRVRTAERKFLRFRASHDERRDAVRDLADVLEFLRPQLKEVLADGDESDLFNIANNFGIRHHRENQKSRYDKDIWHSWMFHYYLATIHASLRLIDREASRGRSAEKPRRS